MIISKTPMRISFFGGGTDYPAWFTEHGGAVLSTTIDKYTYISARYLPPFFEHKYRVVWSRIENVNTIDEINHPAVRACLHYLKFTEGVVINHDGDLPAQSGMGTSSSFTVGLLHALHALRGKPNYPRSNVILANEAIYVEQNLIKNYVGNQDQIAAAIGGLNLIRFNKNWKAERILLPNNELEKRLMLVFTGLSRNSYEIATSYQFDKAAVLSRMYDLVFLAEKALHKSQWEDFGLMLDESWNLKCQLSPGVCTPYIGYLYEKAKLAGAIGGKLLGAGGGGFLLILCEPDKQQAVKDALKGLLFVPFHFEDKGTQIIGNGNAGR